MGKADQGIGGRHPPEVQGTGLHGLDLLPDGKTGGRVDGTRCQAPGLLKLGAVAGIRHRAVTRQ